PPGCGSGCESARRPRRQRCFSRQRQAQVETGGEMVTGSSSMTIAERLARFAARASFDDLSEAAREQLKIRVLDALACAIGALDGEPVRLLRAQVADFDGSGPCALRDAGFDHVTQGAYAVAAGSARALGLDPAHTAHAIAIAGTAFNALRVTRTGPLSHWKGLAYPNVAGAVTRTTFLARRGITGPLEVFEGEKGFMDAVAGYFELNWETEDLERVTQTILKKYNAEIHSQSVLEAVLELRAREHLSAADVERVALDV